MKECRLCEHMLEQTQFREYAPSPDGRYPYCNACVVRYPNEAGRAMCTYCGANRRLTKFPNLDPAGPCEFCVPNPTSAAPDMLDRATLHREGVMTITELLEAIGLAEPTARDLRAAGRWLRRNKYEVTRQCGRQLFRVGVASNANAFAQWAAQYGAMSALELSPEQQKAYLAGYPIPANIALAMSALAAGLPPWETE